MNKTLIIAEKPSVAHDIAKTLGGFTKYDEYFESDQYVLSSAIGHLLEIAVPEEYDIKRGKWTFTHLPIIPPHFILNPITKTEARLKILTKLIKRKDITVIINACDAGREGELIFRFIVQYTKAKQQIKRLWLQSMTPLAIRDGFSHLRNDKEMIPLADAARCRSEADWLIGINGTRAMTAFNSKEGGFYLTTVGRVQTPTLSIVVEREEKIKQFIPRHYWEIHAEFICTTGTYKGRWLNTEHKKDNIDLEKNAERLWNDITTQSIVNACHKQIGSVSEESKPMTQVAPNLFDLTSLQREANSRFGFSAKNTLGLAQILYEKYKLLTYPRTDSRYLPEDYLQTIQQVLITILINCNYQPFAAQILNNDWIRPNKRIFNNTKIHDHFAIIPTTQTPKNLSESEQKLYDLIMRRFIAVFFPAAEFKITTRYTKISNHIFKTEGKIITKLGWLTVYNQNITKKNENYSMLTPIFNDEKVQVNQVSALRFTTKPSARYTEGTLLSAMESAGKLVDSEELRDAMAGKGLGTPATRAAIIEGLLSEKYLIREGRQIIPTTKAFQLMTLLHGLGVDELTEPELTGEWEYKLALIERGHISRNEFMHDITQMTQVIVKHTKEYNNDTIPGNYVTLKTSCPNCNNIIKENYRRFICTKCEFSISKLPGGRQFEIAEVEELLINRKIGPLQGFRSKTGRPFAAILKIIHNHETKNFKLEFDFSQNSQEENQNNKIPNFNEQMPLGPCPKCGGRVYEVELAYICEKMLAKPKTCDFRSGRIILRQEILPGQITKLLNNGKTDLLPGFISQRTRRPFKAFLVLDKNGRTNFEFEKRKLKVLTKKPIENLIKDVINHTSNN